MACTVLRILFTFWILAADSLLHDLGAEADIGFLMYSVCGESRLVRRNTRAESLAVPMERSWAKKGGDCPNYVQLMYQTAR